MSPGYQIDSVNVTKIVCNFWTKHPSSASCINGPILNIFRIWPHQVAKWTFVRNLYFSIYSSNLVDCFDLWTQTTMDTESFSINYSSDWQIVENFSTVFPWVWISIFSVDFIIKSIYSCDLSFIKKEKYLDSWFPLKSVILSGYFTFKHKRYSKVSTEWYPLSTKSPIKM